MPCHAHGGFGELQARLIRGSGSLPSRRAERKRLVVHNLAHTIWNNVPANGSRSLTRRVASVSNSSAENPESSTTRRDTRTGGPRRPWSSIPIKECRKGLIEHARKEYCITRQHRACILIPSAERPPTMSTVSFPICKHRIGAPRQVGQRITVRLG